MSDDSKRAAGAGGTAPSPGQPLPRQEAGTPGCVWGILAICLLLTGWQWREIHRVMTVYRETTCTIVEKEVRRGDSDGDAEPGYSPWFRFTHQLGGRRYEATGYEAMPYEWGFRADVEAIVGRYRVGEQVRCWYDPLSPSRAVLVRFSGLLALAIPLLLTGITVVLAAALLVPRLPVRARRALSRAVGLRADRAGTEADTTFRWFVGCFGAALVAWNLLFAYLMLKSWQDWRAGHDDGAKLLVAGIVLTVTWVAQVFFARDWRRRHED